MAVQKGPLWWAAHHRRHHKYTDQKGDIHSPVKDGFWWSHIGWVISRKYDPTDWNAIKDFSRFPELRWLNTYHVVPPIVLAVMCFFGGVLFGVREQHRADDKSPHQPLPAAHATQRSE